jgi:hypothetical protein
MARVHPLKTSESTLSMRSKLSGGVYFRQPPFSLCPCLAVFSCSVAACKTQPPPIMMGQLPFELLMKLSIQGFLSAPLAEHTLHYPFQPRKPDLTSQMQCNADRQLKASTTDAIDCNVHKATLAQKSMGTHNPPDSQAAPMSHQLCSPCICKSQTYRSTV